MVPRNEQQFLTKRIHFQILINDGDVIMSLEESQAMHIRSVLVERIVVANHHEEVEILKLSDQFRCNMDCLNRNLRTVMEKITKEKDVCDFLFL